MFMGAIVLMGNHYTVDNVFQWDKDQVLEIRGLNLAFKPEIHFTNHTMDRAIVRQSSVDDAGIITTMVPNSLLQVSYPIKVYVCGYEGQSFKTYYNFTIPVVGREKPKDYNLLNDEEIYSFNKIEYKVNNFNYDILQTVKSWIENSLTANKSGRILDAYQGRVLLDRIENEEKKTGVLSDLLSEKKENIVSAINSIINTFDGKIGKLNKLATGSKENIVVAINELLSKINTHKHDSRYYTETEIDTKTGDLTTLNTTEKTNFVGSINEVLKGLTDHKTSKDHDKRYHTKTEIKTMIGLLTDLTTNVKTNIVGAINEVLDSLTTHKTSTDHDERYYQKTEVDTITGDFKTLTTTVKDSIVNVVNEIVTNISDHKSSGDHDTRYYQKTEIDEALKNKQDTLTSPPLMVSDIVNDVKTRDASKPLSAEQGYNLNSDLTAISDRFGCISALANNSTPLTFDNTFSGFVSVDTYGDPKGGALFYVYAYGTGVGQIAIHTIYKGDLVYATVEEGTNIMRVVNTTGKKYYVSVFTLFNRKPTGI